MTNIEKNTTYYFLTRDPNINFTLDEFIDLEMLAFLNVQKQNTPLFCQHKSKVLGSFFVSLN